jgi:O-methyltransferase involved in polyketide biosynthesis
MKPENPTSNPEIAENRFERISPTALHLAYYREIAELPYAKEISHAIHAKESAEPYLVEQLSLVPVMEARFIGTNTVLEKYLLEQPNAQILELAAGLSSRGLYLTDKFPDTTYLETDLSEISQTKKDLIQNLSLQRQNLSFQPLNALDAQALYDIIAGFDHSRPLMIVNEGLMNYLNLSEKQKLAESVKSILSEFEGIWVTPDPALTQERRRQIRLILSTYAENERKTEAMTGQKYDDFSFSDEAAADNFFVQAGFHMEKFSQMAEDQPIVSLGKSGLDANTVSKLKQNILDFGKVWAGSSR